MGKERMLNSMCVEHNVIQYTRRILSYMKYLKAY